MSSIRSKTRAEINARVLAALALLCATNASIARAEPPEPAPSSSTGDAKTHAKRLFEQGQAHYDLGEYDEAIAAFREAYEISSAPALLFNIAQSHRLKGDCARALQVYRHFVRLDPDSSHRVAAENQISLLTAQCDHKTQATPATSASAGSKETPTSAVHAEGGAPAAGEGVRRRTASETRTRCAPSVDFG